MKKGLAFLLIGFVIGVAITFGFTLLLEKPGKMFWLKEDMTIALDTTAHIENRQDERYFLREMVLPKGTCLNDDGASLCPRGVRFLNLTLAFQETNIENYFSKGSVEGNTPITRVLMLYRTGTEN